MYVIWAVFQVISFRFHNYLYQQETHAHTNACKQLHACRWHPQLYKSLKLLNKILLNKKARSFSDVNMYIVLFSKLCWYWPGRHAHTSVCKQLHGCRWHSPCTAWQHHFHFVSCLPVLGRLGHSSLIGWTCSAANHDRSHSVDLQNIYNWCFFMEKV